jgi:hypothetical protein
VHKLERGTEVALQRMKKHLLLAIVSTIVLAEKSPAEDPIFSQTFKYSPSFSGRKVVAAKKDPVVRIMVTKAEKTSVGARIQSGEWLEIGDSAFTSNASKPMLNDAMTMGRRLGADQVFYQVTSAGIQTLKQVVVSPKYVEGQSGYYNTTTNLPGVGPVVSSGTYGTSAHVELNPHLATARVHRYTHWIVYVKTPQPTSTEKRSESRKDANSPTPKPSPTEESIDHYLKRMRQKHTGTPTPKTTQQD